jgi:DNA-binding CsgD family transcriptional regulator
MELLSVFGFSLMFGWFFVTFFWFFVSTGDASDAALLPSPSTLSTSVCSLALTLLFIGIPLGDVAMRFAALRLRERLNARLLLVLSTVVALLLSGTLTLVSLGIPVPDTLIAVLSLLTGMASAVLLAGWLDICGRTRIRNVLVCTTASFSGGALWYVLCVLLPALAQPPVSAFFLLASLALLFYMGSRSEAPAELRVEKRDSFLTSPREVEPVFLMLGAAAGIVFALLIAKGPLAIVGAMVAILLASLLMLALAALRLKISVVLLLRVLIVITVGTLLALSALPPEPFWMLLGCIGAAVWAVFSAANYANLVKLIVEKNLPILYHVSSGTLPKSAGFVVGWCAALAVLYSGVIDEKVSYLLLVAAFLLVVVAMVFYPEKKHHDDNAIHSSDFILKLESTASEDSVLNAKCEALARLYRLSPREADILTYLIRGRNAKYICEKLVISEHTVKSHIYSIYLKTDVHSQQKLMDLVEEFSVEQDTDQMLH